MIVGVMAAILVAMAMVLVRAVYGPSVYDRILAANSFGTKTVIFIALLSYALNDAIYIDIALIYVLINFITTIGFMKYFKYQSLGSE